MGKRHFDSNGNPDLSQIIKDVCGFYHHHAYEQAQRVVQRFSGTPINKYEQEGKEARFMAKMIKDFNQIPVRGIYIFGSQAKSLVQKVEETKNQKGKLPEGVTVENNQTCLYPNGYPFFYESYLHDRDLDIFTELDIDERYFIPREFYERHAWFRTLKFLLKDPEDYPDNSTDLIKRYFIDIYTTENGVMTEDNVRIFHQPRLW